MLSILCYTGYYQIIILFYLTKHSSSLIVLSYTRGTEQTNYIHGAGGSW